MKKIFAALTLAVALAAYASVGHADSLSIGKMILGGKTIRLTTTSFSAIGKASFVNKVTDAPIKADTIRLDSLKADTIKVDISKAKNGKWATKKATAVGNVVISGKRANAEVDSNGRRVVVLQNIHATAQSAEMHENDNKVVLNGNVIVKILDPGTAEPLYVAKGEKVTVSLKDAEIIIDGQSDGQAEITVTPKEKEK